MFGPLGRSRALNTVAITHLCSPFRCKFYNCATAPPGGLGRKTRIGPDNPLFHLHQNHSSLRPNPEFQNCHSVGVGQGPGVCILSRLSGDCDVDGTLRTGGLGLDNSESLSPTETHRSPYRGNIGVIAILQLGRLRLGEVN